MKRKYSYLYSALPYVIFLITRIAFQKEVAYIGLALFLYAWVEVDFFRKEIQRLGRRVNGATVFLAVAWFLVESIMDWGSSFALIPVCCTITHLELFFLLPEDSAKSAS